MPSSPRTPTRRRKSSNLDQSFSSPPSIQYSPTQKRSSRKYSIPSLPSPTSVKSASVYDDSLQFGASNGLDGGADESNGLGNLADELAEAWDDESGRSPQMENVIIQNREDGLTNGHGERPGPPTFEIRPGTGVGMPNRGNGNQSLSPPKQSMRSKPRRKPSNASDYDGSDHGGNPDLEHVEGFSVSLERRLAAIESLARRGTEFDGSGAEKIVTRVADRLRNLGSQAGVETGATRFVLTSKAQNHLGLPSLDRLMTAHTAVASNLAYQIRLIQTLSHHFISPFSMPPAADEIDALLPLLATTLELLPPTNPRAVSSLHSLHSSAVELIAALSTLADSLHMLRQTTSLASRKLKAAKDIVDELRREAELREEGTRWVEKGNWDTRLSNRECGAICGDVVDGFRNVCERWEESIRENTLGDAAFEMAAG
ncbi:MAG: hypothetical protein Q9225_000672 [Loekoesia sp. 1 TL-2023]